MGDAWEMIRDDDIILVFVLCLTIWLFGGHCGGEICLVCYIDVEWKR